MEQHRQSARLSRRALIASLGSFGAGLLVLAVAGCQPPAPTPTSAPPTTRPPEPMPTRLAGTPTPTDVPAPAPATATRPPSPTLAIASPTRPTQPTTAPPTAKPAAKVSGVADLAVVRGPSPADITRAAVEAIGGISRFVPKGSTVVVKPNICVSSPPEYAATTNPEVVATLVRLCKEAGAGKVKVLDYGFAGQRTSYAESGIEAAVKQAGGDMVPISPLKWKMTQNPKAREAKALEVFEDVLTADVLINVPIAKHHNLSRLTLAMKNLMGTINYRELLHANLGQQLSDLALLVKPAFTLLDAVRILVRGGPQGGDLSYVKRLDTVIASTDMVAVDAYASTFFDLKPDDLETVRAGQANGLGTYELSKLKIAEVRRG